ncbi:hypothetical protein LQF76_06790 [Gloeomargaritales cyanobacterium VI4D9]|nr:hypothetical protein LQF76_06790 [Gloeomargaritales cyanobacterium VI4D9]
MTEERVWFYNQNPDSERIECIVRMLSTFQDGSGERREPNIQKENGQLILTWKTLPGGFDFEMVIAEALGGIPLSGGKFVYDIIFPMFKDEIDQNNQSINEQEHTRNLISKIEMFAQPVKDNYKVREKEILYKRILKLPSFSCDIIIGFLDKMESERGQTITSKNITEWLKKNIKNPFYGISCKSSDKNGNLNNDETRIRIEISNAASKFSNAIRKSGVDLKKIWELCTGGQRNDCENDLKEIGRAIMEVVNKINTADSSKIPKKSKALLKELYGDCGFDFPEPDKYGSYLCLASDGQGNYRVLRYKHKLPDADSVDWTITSYKNQYNYTVTGKSKGDQGNVIEFYSGSGGQFKYFPKIGEATWKSDVFQLKRLNEGSSIKLTDKLNKYFPPDNYPLNSVKFLYYYLIWMAWIFS